jgi:spore maturation protein CgeB
VKRVLLLCSDFMWYAESIEQAFCECGWNTKMLKSHIGPNNNNYIIRLKSLLHKDITNFLEKKRDIFSTKAIKEFDRFKPDLVYVTLGNQLTPEAIRYMKKNAYTVLKLSDTLSVYPYLQQVVSIYDRVYTYEISDIEELKKYGVTGHRSMGTYDSKQYFPIDCSRDIDVCFVGKMYPQRKELLERLIEDLPDVKFRFWGTYVKVNKPIKYLNWMFSKKHKVFANKNIHYSEVNEIYNRSKICLNINGYQTQIGWASRLPEILGTRSFQLVDGNEAINSEFNGCLATFYTYEDLKNKILYYLKHDDERKQIAINGYEKVIHSYTRKHQIESILNDIQSDL